MLKIKVDTSDLEFDDVLDGIKDRFKAAVASTVAQADTEAHRIANAKLKSASAKEHWNRGFKVDKISDDFYVVSVEGELSNWMEQGIDVGEVSRSILSGNRAEANRGEGKNYVDVPIAKDADQAGNIRGTKINVQAFKSADDVMKFINTSDWKRGGIQKKQVIANRVQDIIKNTSPKSGKTSYMTIRRLSENSDPWPSTPYAGANVLQDLDAWLDQNFGSILERYL